VEEREEGKEGKEGKSIIHVVHYGDERSLDVEVGDSRTVQQV
jgi:hypothetical protein